MVPPDGPDDEPLAAFLLESAVVEAVVEAVVPASLGFAASALASGEAAPESDPPPLLEDPSAAAAARVGLEDVELRSFFAQPEPLKWIDGALNALRTGDAPHTTHDSGPSAVTPWMTSNRWPFGQR